MEIKLEVGSAFPAVWSVDVARVAVSYENEGEDQIMVIKGHLANGHLCTEVRVKVLKMTRKSRKPRTIKRRRRKASKKNLKSNE